MTDPGTRRRRGLPAAFLLLSLFAGIVVADAFVSLHKGGDFDVFLEAGARLLAGHPLYEGSSVGSGVIGPPFQALFFAPFALVAWSSPLAAKLLWYLASWAALALGVMAWRGALEADGSNPAEAGSHAELAEGIQAESATGSQAKSAAGSQAASVRGRRWAILLPLVAVALPVQTNFEHLNLNPVLLLLLGVAAAALTHGWPRVAGIAAGAAAALKVFPALWIVYFFARRRWRSATWAGLTALLLTVLPVLRYGRVRFLADLGRWWEISAQGGWPIRGNNQSLFAMVGRYFGKDGLGATGHLFSGTDPLPYWIGLAAAAVLLGLLALIAVQRRSEPVRVVELAVITGAAVLLSPIAWDHYWVLFFPAFCAVRKSAWVFWPAALLTSGFSRVTVGASGLALARALSTTTWAGILLVGYLGWQLSELAKFDRDEFE